MAQRFVYLIMELGIDQYFLALGRGIFSLSLVIKATCNGSFNANWINDVGKFKNTVLFGKYEDTKPINWSIYIREIHVTGIKRGSQQLSFDTNPNTKERQSTCRLNSVELICEYRITKGDIHK